MVVEKQDVRRRRASKSGAGGCVRGGRRTTIGDRPFSLGLRKLVVYLLLVIFEFASV